MEEKNNYSIGFCPGHTYTIFYISRNYTVLKYNFVKNIEFYEKIEKIFFELLEKIKIEEIKYVSVFTGPSPLTTTRSICSFIKGMIISKKIKVITCFGSKYYSSHFYDHIFINIFGQRCFYYNNLKKTENKISFMEVNEIIKKIPKNETIGISKGIPINFDNNKKKISTFLFPNPTSISYECYNKFKLNNFSDISKIIPMESY